MAVITDKQANYIKSLLKGLDRTLNRDVEQITKLEATKLIGYLIAKCKPKDDAQEKFFSDYVPAEPEEPGMIPGTLFPVDKDETLPF